VFVVLLLATPVVTAQEDWPVCPSVDAQHPAPPTYPCGYKPAATKPAGLAQPAPAVDPEPGWPCAALTGPMYEACKGTYHPTSATSRPAERAQPDPRATTPLDPCGPSVGLDPRLCQSTDTAKPTGLAQPVSATEEVGMGCLGPKGSIAWRACAFAAPVSRAAAKPAGLAQPAPAETEQQLVDCSSSSRLDPWNAACR
jgi:hypothetical protein